MSVRAKMESLLEGWNKGRTYDQTSGSWKEPSRQTNPWKDHKQEVVDNLKELKKYLTRAAQGSSQLARKVKQGQPKKASVADKVAREASAALKSVDKVLEGLAAISKM